MTSPTQRLPDWMLRLDAFVQTARIQPFAWGSHDCCTVAAAVVEACTGVDVMGDVRWQYDTALGAARVVDGLGGMAALLADRLGPEVPLLCAQSGDIGLCDDGRVVWFGGSMWHGPGDHGLVTTDAPARVWRCHV
jgi:hypothetical protein